MIPITSTVRIRNQRRRGSAIWIPLFLVWLLLLPVALLLLPLIFVAFLVVRVNPFRALSTLWEIVTALKGTDVEVDDGHYSVLVRIH
jgi:uncharacterized membrane protein